MADWICRPKINQILLSFCVPRTPRQVEKQLGVRKLKMKPFLEKRLLKSLTPGARKGRLYMLTDKARRLIELPSAKAEKNKDWDSIGWVMASPKQRLIVLEVMDLGKRTSEEIRERASRSNPHLTRISTKAILKELVGQGLIETELNKRKRYYWMSEKGRLVVDDVNRLLADGNQESRGRIDFI